MAHKYVGLAIVSIFFISCRYKSNDKFIVGTVKQRIEKTWFLKKYVLNGVDYSVSRYNTITFFDMNKNSVAIKIDKSDIGSLYVFKNNKTTLVRWSETSGGNLKIIKLTKDELWLEGDRIINTSGFRSDDKILAKYGS